MDYYGVYWVKDNKDDSLMYITVEEEIDIENSMAVFDSPYKAEAYVRYMSSLYPKTKYVIKKVKVVIEGSK